MFYRTSTGSLNFFFNSYGENPCYSLQPSDLQPPSILKIALTTHVFDEFSKSFQNNLIFTSGKLV